MTPDAVAPSPSSSNEHAIIKWLLRLGLCASSVLMLAGLILRAANGETGTPPAPLFHLVGSGDVGSCMMAVGVLGLALTPIMRVAALALIWVKERDWPFVAVAIFVLAMLGLSILLGRG